MALFGNNAPAKQKFRRTYSGSDFTFPATITIPAITWTNVGSLTVPAQQEITFGANDPTGGSTVAGAPVYIKLHANSSAQITAGKLRLALTDATETRTIVCIEEDLSRLAVSSSGDRTLSVLLPEFPIKAKQDSKLKIQLYLDSATTFVTSTTNTNISLPVTVYY